MVQCIEKLTEHVLVHKSVTKLMRCFHLVNKAVYTAYPVWFIFNI